MDIWLVHGLGDSPRVWRDVRKQPAVARHRVFAPALPGFGGEQPLPPRERSVDGLARWLEAQIRRHSHGRDVAIIGHSMGGMIGTLVAARMPELHGLIDVDGPLTLSDLEVSRQAAETRDFAAWFRAFKRNVRDPRSPAPQHYAASVDEADAASFHACVKDIVALARGSRMAKIYAALRVPRLFYFGRSEGGISKRSQNFLRSHRCKTVAFARAGHWPMWETPAQFERELAHSLAVLGKVTRAS